MRTYVFKSSSFVSQLSADTLDPPGTLETSWTAERRTLVLWGARPALPSNLTLDRAGADSRILPTHLHRVLLRRRNAGGALCSGELLDRSKTSVRPMPLLWAIVLGLQTDSNRTGPPPMSTPWHSVAFPRLSTHIPSS
jgi:hypothetical protein